MKVLFECRSIYPNKSGGIENFTYMLVNAWAKFYPTDEIILNIPPGTISLYSTKVDSRIKYILDPIWEEKVRLSEKNILYKVFFKLIEFIFPFLGGFLNGYRKNWAKINDEAADVVICTFHKAKIVHSTDKLILVVHDFRNWDFDMPSRAREKTIKEQTQIIKNSSRLVVCWPYPLRRLSELFPEKTDKTTMIPFLFEPYTESIEKNHKGDYLYYSSNNEIHKNHENLIKGLAIYNMKHPGNKLKLVCTGNALPERTKYLNKLIREERLEYFVDFMGFVDRKQVNELYKNAFAVITPSKYEAFSGTILEAFGHKKQVFGSSIPANIEFLNYYNLDILLFDADSPQKIAQAIQHMDENYEENLIKAEKGFNTLKYITPKYTVDMFREIASEIISNNV